jgi:hypothetical protein
MMILELQLLQTLPIQVISNIRSSKKQFRASILKQVDEFCCSQIRAAALRLELRRGTKVLEFSNLETLSTLLGKAIESKLIRKRAKQTNKDAISISHSSLFSFLTTQTKSQPDWRLRQTHCTRD